MTAFYEIMTARLGISTTRVASITAHKLTFVDCYGLYIDPATHTPPVVASMNAIYDIFHPEMLALKQQLNADMDITLTMEDYASLFIHQDVDKRSKVPAPKFAPLNQIIKQNRLVTTVFTSNPIAPHETEKFKPVDVALIGRKMIIVEADEAIPAQEKFLPLDPIGAVIFDIVFKLEDIGKIAYLITWYQSPTGESGPISEPLQIKII